MRAGGDILMSTEDVIDTGRHLLSSGHPPDWASGWGQDRYGIFAEIYLEHPNDWRGVEQRLRWIPPGKFTMGSPLDESERFEQEGPETEVTIRDGFWLFDTPVTQELYELVTGENPSSYKSSTRPVQNIHWGDANQFIEMMNVHIAGLNLRMPSEAEWEYACRAGTRTATYAGSMETFGLNNAPVLEEIAWYGGNCGRDWDLDDGFDLTKLPQRRYDDPIGGTHPVAVKRPNLWGLYDMLGNVSEWCADEWHGNHADANPFGIARCPSQLPRDLNHVARGGSWISRARYLRSACRTRPRPWSLHGHGPGLRCAGDQVTR